MNRYTYLVIENAPDVCEGIIRRMAAFNNWRSLGYCVGVKEAIEKIANNKPDLIYLDWSLNGGSAFEILQQVQNHTAYDPYIIFNTGFQKDNPEIPQEIINKYKVDKYLIKPLWENLRNNLPHYLAEAEDKMQRSTSKKKILWLEDIQKNKVWVDLNKVICVCQHATEARSRDIYVAGKKEAVTVPLQWHKIEEILNQHQIDFFITKNRSHLIVKTFVEKFEKPFVRLQGLTAFKIEVVKANIKAFEEWLIN